MILKIVLYPGMDFYDTIYSGVFFALDLCWSTHPVSFEFLCHVCQVVPVDVGDRAVDFSWVFHNFIFSFTEDERLVLR